MNTNIGTYIDSSMNTTIDNSTYIDSRQYSCTYNKCGTYIDSSTTTITSISISTKSKSKNSNSNSNSSRKRKTLRVKVIVRVVATMIGAVDN